jgi:hypothetical protein
MELDPVSTPLGPSHLHRFHGYAVAAKLRAAVSRDFVTWSLIFMLARRSCANTYRSEHFLQSQKCSTPGCSAGGFASAEKDRISRPSR